MARKQSTDSSLELLLDTITNTFGSVLFLTILVTLLLRSEGGESSAERQPERAMSASDQAALEARIQEAQRECDRLRERLAGFPPPEKDVAALYAVVLEREQDAEKVAAEITALDARILEEQRVAQAVESERQRIEEALAEVKPRADEQERRRRRLEEEASALARVALELDRPVDPAEIVQTAVLPVLGATDKKQVGLYMRYGRVYMMHRWNNAGDRVPNPDHFIITPGPGGTQVATARPDAGVIADGATIRREVADMLRNFPAEQWVVAVIVYEDSFAQFQAVKSALIELGYQYEPIRTGPDDPVRDRGGVGRAQ